LVEPRRHISVVNKILTNKLFLNTTLSTSGYDYNLYTDVSKDERWNSHISNVNLKSDFSFFLKPQNEITFGVGLNGYKFNPGNLQSGSANQKTSNTSVRNSLEFVLYGNQENQSKQTLGLKLWNAFLYLD
jgi:hypothetical protein